MPAHGNEEEKPVLQKQFFKSTLSSGKFGNNSLF